MKKSDIDLINKLNKIIKIYIDDQARQSPLHEIKNVPSEIHGHLADLLFIDKVENEALVNFIVGMLYADKNIDDAETMKLIRNISAVLEKLSTN
jgi:hypothetical protein